MTYEYKSKQTTISRFSKKSEVHLKARKLFLKILKAGPKQILTKLVKILAAKENWR